MDYKYIIYLVDNSDIERYMNDRNCRKSDVSFSFVKNNYISVLYSTNSESDFNDKYSFYAERYSSNMSSVMGYDTETGNYISY